MENSKLPIGLLLLCGILLTVKTAYGCMCARSHPQQSLCREGSFAAQVKIRNIEYVYTIERPKHEDAETNDTELDGKNATVTDLESSKRETNQEMEQVEVVVKAIDQVPEQHLLASYIRYRVKVYETYRGLKPDELQGKKTYVYTSPYGSLCGADLKTKEMYLLIGSVYNGHLMIGLCDNYFMWNSLDARQRRAIRRNMREAQTTCASSCQIQTCWSTTGCANQNKDTCMWTSQIERINNKLNIHPANFACSREPGKQDARCQWNDALTNGKRGIRRRRHHSSKSRPNVRPKSRLILLP